MESRWSKQREEEQADRETEPDSHTAIMSGKQTERVRSEKAHTHKYKNNEARHTPSEASLNILLT